MTGWDLATVFFVYGLAFFAMGLAVWLEGGRASDPRLRRALWPLALFGLIHGGHEWIEMFQQLGRLPGQLTAGAAWEATRIGVIVGSFLLLATSGAYLLAVTEPLRRRALWVPLGLTLVWGVGSIAIVAYPGSGATPWAMLDVWARYVVGVPGALLAAIGLVIQQREFRRAGLHRFGRDSLWAAVAFFWYGAVGQVFVRASALPPSDWLNQDLFFAWFGFPIQLLRAGCAMLVAVFVIRFLRAFEVEAQGRMLALQAARLEEAQHRDALRRELLQRVVGAQEAERQRVARELHDATGQSLTALGLGLHSISPLLGRNLVLARDRLGRLEALVNTTLDELRQVIADLRPPQLDDLGLPAALRWLAQTQRMRATLLVRVSIVGRERGLEPATRIALFRIAQEALTNAVKHGQASTVDLKLDYAPDAVILRVVDDGQGFVVRLSEERDRPAWGLLGMQERAALLGGQCAINSAPGSGATVEVRIPDAAQEAAS